MYFSRNLNHNRWCIDAIHAKRSGVFKVFWDETHAYNGNKLSSVQFYLTPKYKQAFMTYPEAKWHQAILARGCVWGLQEREANAGFSIKPLKPRMGNVV